MISALILHTFYVYYESAKCWALLSSVEHRTALGGGMLCWGPQMGIVVLVVSQLRNPSGTDVASWPRNSFIPAVFDLVTESPELCGGFCF